LKKKEAESKKDLNYIKVEDRWEDKEIEIVIYNNNKMSRYSKINAS
jgi:hypothetical protein